jgi:hypothetical protein
MGAATAGWAVVVHTNQVANGSDWVNMSRPLRKESILEIHLTFFQSTHNKD